MRAPATLLFVIAAVLLLAPGWSGEERLALLGDRAAAATAARVPLDPADPARRRLGRLTYLGGVRLDSADPAFGGFSALQVAGDRITLLSDGGNIVSFRIDPRGRIDRVRFAELPGGPGTGWNKRDRDSESMVRDPATGRLWVGFERANAIWRTRPASRAPSAACGRRRCGAGEAMAAPSRWRGWRTAASSSSPSRRRTGRGVRRWCSRAIRR